MFGLTPLGTFHTAISLIAVVAGFVALARDREISTKSAAGSLFFWGTVITCLTGFGIFQHGGFGKPHVLGTVTLIVLGGAVAGEPGSAFGRVSPCAAARGESLALFLHLLSATLDTLTSLPASPP